MTQYLLPDESIKAATRNAKQIIALIGNLGGDDVLELNWDFSGQIRSAYTGETIAAFDDAFGLLHVLRTIN